MALRGVGVLVFALAVFTFPTSADAASALVWGEVSMEDGKSYTVTLNEARSAWVTSDSPLAEFGAEGILFFVPDPLLPARQFVSNVGGFFDPEEVSWAEPGTYEVDVYASEPVVPVRAPDTRFFAWLLGTEARAAATPTFIETIRFTVSEEPPEPPPVAECCSSVVFLPGLKGSILKTATETLWPADASGTDIPELALNDDGTSVNDIFVDGILPDFKINVPLLGSVGPEIYSGFSSFMDALVANDTDDINLLEWEPFPYDWRYPPEHAVTNDVETPGGPVNLIERVEALAASSPTGKITIVAHSMGGLVGKALIKALDEQGKAGLIDAFVMIASPQLGTPQAAASLLHGDQEGIPGKTLIPNLFTTTAVARAAGRNFPGAYSLLPSERYFDDVTDPVIVFNKVLFTKPWRDFWGDAVSAYAPFVEFLTGIGVPRERPHPSLSYLPEVLRADLVAAAGDFHDTYDDYIFPSNIRVVQVAGWGEETTKAVRYKTEHLVFQSYDTDPTIEGDGTVVYPSAIASSGEQYYFDLFEYKSSVGVGLDHGTLLNSTEIQDVAKSIIAGFDVEENDFIKTAKPIPDNVEDRLRISSYSPVILGAYDTASGKYTGIYPGQDLSAAFLYVKQDIPGSSFVVSGESQHLYLPKEGTYTVVYKGVGTGPTTVEIAEFSHDAVSLIATYSDIPTTPQSSATLVVDSVAPGVAPVEVDENGDEVPELVISPDTGAKTFEELLAELKTVVLGFSDAKIKSSFLKRAEKLEQKIQTQKTKKSKTLQNLEDQVTKKSAKGKIDTASASEIIALVDELQTQVGTFPLDPALIAALRAKVESLAITQNLKNSLLKKIERLEKLTGISTALSNFVSAIERKSDKGKLSPADTQTLTNLLTQLESAL